MKIQGFILFLIFGYSVNLNAQTKSTQPKSKKSQTTEENWTILQTATAQEIMKNYEMAIENYELFISKVYDPELKHVAYGHLGYCLANTTKYQEAIPYLTRYLDYFSHSEVTPLTLEKINTSNQDVGKFQIQRGFCKSKLEDFYGAEKDLTKGIKFLEMLVKSPKYKEDWQYETLGFGYLIRGLTKMQMNQGKIFCEDLRKSIELGYTQGIESVKNYCN